MSKCYNSYLRNAIILCSLFFFSIITPNCKIDTYKTQILVYCKDGLYKVSLDQSEKPVKEKILSPEIIINGESITKYFTFYSWLSPFFFFPKNTYCNSLPCALCWPLISDNGEKHIVFGINPPGKNIISWIQDSNSKVFLDFIFNEQTESLNYWVKYAWFSPAKKEIFYIIYDNVYEKDGDKNKIELWKTDLNLKNKVGLTEELESLNYNRLINFYPSVILSPDGEKILFYIGDYLWIMNSDGTGKRNISEEMEKEIGKNEPELEVYVKGLQANFTPDGRKIVMFLEVRLYEEESDWEDNEYELWIMDIDGSNKKKLLGKIEEGILWYQFLLTPDGNKIIFYIRTSKENNEGTVIWSMDIDGNNKKNLTTFLKKELETKIYGFQDFSFIAVSPSGEKIVFEFAYYDEKSKEIVLSLGIANTDGSGARDLLKEAKEKYPELNQSLRFYERSLSFFYPCFTPDSKNIVFISYGGPYLWIISDDGKNIVNLSKTCDLKIWSGFIESFLD